MKPARLHWKLNVPMLSNNLCFNFENLNEIILECEDLGSHFEIDYKNKFEFNFIKMANDET